MEKLFASIITIGDELLIGQTVDTNSAFIGQAFNKMGITVKRRVAVGDVWEDIWKALDEESAHSQIIIITGGLGPTADDITKPLLAEYFGGKLVLNEDVLAHVQYLFKEVYRRPEGFNLERNKKQAEVPDNCTVLFNKRGTAAGMWFKKYLDEEKIEKRIFVSLPGVPFEMKGLITDEVLPRLQEEFKMPFVAHRTIVTAGMGESLIAERIQEFEENLPANIKLAYLPSYGMVRLRLSGFGLDEATIAPILTKSHQELYELVKDIAVIDEDKTLPIVVGEILSRKEKTMGTAESCTGGYIAHLITSIAGSSGYFKGSIVSYANEVKENVLGVPNKVLQTVGAVSEETVQQMVRGTLAQLNVDYAVATSGIMGPGGATSEKPVGTVWIAVGNKEKIETKLLHLRFDRERNIEMTAHMALNLLRKFILEN